MVHLALFDIDGTLIHSGGAGVRAFQHALHSQFHIPNGTERLKFAGRTDTGLARELFFQHSIEATPENFALFFDAYVHWLDHLLAESEGGTQPGVWEFIRDLRRLAEPPVIGLLTGNLRLGAEIKLRHFDLWEVFQTGAFADDHEDRDQIAIIARQRGIQMLGRELTGDEILVVGDTPRDIRCARAINARMLAVATGGSSFDDLAVQQPAWLVESLFQVTAAEICR